MNLNKLILSLTIPFTLCLASCSNEDKQSEHLKDITTSEVVRVTNIDLSKVKSVSITSDLSKIKHKLDHHYITLYKDDRHVILKFPTDLDDPSNPNPEKSDDIFLTIFTTDKIEHLTKDYLNYEFTTEISLSSSSLSSSILSSTGKIDNDAFYYTKSLETLSLRNLDFGTTTNLDFLFGGFESCTNLKEVDMTGAKTSSVTSTVGMFAQTAINSLKGFDTSKVASMDLMFAYTTSTSLTLDSLFSLSSAVSLSSMFRQTQFTELNLADLKPARHLKDISNMFYESKNLAKLDLTNFTFSNDGLDCRNMFYQTGSLAKDNLSYKCTAPFNFSQAKTPSVDQQTKYNLTDKDEIIEGLRTTVIIVTGSLGYANSSLASLFGVTE